MFPATDPASAPGATLVAPSVVAGTEPTTSRPTSRLVGVDIARAVAVVGMLLMHTAGPTFPRPGENRLVNGLVAVFHGRSAVTFVFVAGIGFELQAARRSTAVLRHATLARAAVLYGGGVGLALLAGEYAAVILAFYAVYFVLALPARRLGTRWLIAVGLGLAVVVPSAQALFPELLYGPAWLDRFLPNWLPSPSTLLVAGYYAALPWFGFFLVGMAVARLVAGGLPARTVAVVGLVCLLTIHLGVGLTQRAAFDAPWPAALGVGEYNKDVYGELDNGWTALSESQQELADDAEPLAVRLTDPPQRHWSFVTTEGHRPTPTALLASLAFALTLVAALLVVGDRFALVSVPAVWLGRLALTFYVTHLVALSQGWWLRAGDQRPLSSVLGRDAAFVAVFVVAAGSWLRFFRKGPLEAVVDWCCQPDRLRRRSGAAAPA